MSFPANDAEPGDWPRRWHQIVAEYNTSFEHEQNRMRTYFENRFDTIRRENDENVRKVRQLRDVCTARTCDVIDEQAEVAEGISGLKQQIAMKEEEDLALDFQITTLKALSDRLSLQLREAENSCAQRQVQFESETLQLAALKASLRDEIRDLTGFIAMHKRVSTDPDTGKGSSIITTVPHGRRNHR